MISNLSATSKIKVSNLDLDKNDTYFKLEDLEITPKGVEQRFKSKKYGYDNVTVKAAEGEELNITPSLEGQTYEGLYNKVNVEEILTEELNVLPSSETQINEGIFNKVTVAGDNNLMPENIVKGTTVFGVEGTAKTTNARITSGGYLFYYGNRLDNFDEIIKLCDWPVITALNHMFYMCSTTTSLDVSSFDTSNVTEMNDMFNGCGYLTLLDVSNFDTSKVTNMKNMFNSCKGLTELNLSNFDTSKVTNMYCMFGNLRLTSLDLSNFDTSSVTTMSQMFYYSDRLTSLDVSSFDTSNVTDMSQMFYRCEKLTSLDVSNFDTSNVTTMRGMFCSCVDLTSLDLSNFDMGKVKDVLDMFNSYTSVSNYTSFKSFYNLGKGYTQKSNNYSNYRIWLHRVLNKCTRDTIMDIINNGLYDLNLTYDVANGGTLYTQVLDIGSTNLAKLTADDIAIATNKGWTVK